MSIYMDKLLNLMRSQTAGMLSQISHMRIGLISQYDSTTYSAQVTIQPENMLTGWLPIATQWMGNGWGFYSPPSANDAVIVIFMEGSLSVGFIVGRLFNNVDKPIATPTGVPKGEAWFVHKTGTTFKFKNDGTVTMECKDTNGDKTNFEITANMIINGNITQTGDISQTGSISTTGNILDNNQTNSNTVKDMRDIYDEHKHGGIFIGTDKTELPDHNM